MEGTENVDSTTEGCDTQHSGALDENITPANSDKKHEVSKDKGAGKFHVDRELIPAAQLSLGDTQTSDELKDLGINVFNQDDFEQGITEQTSVVDIYYAFSYQRYIIV